MAKHNFESERIQVSDTRESLEITISGSIPRMQFTLLSAWLLAWTLARRPASIQMAVTLAIYGHHFRKVCAGLGV